MHRFNPTFIPTQSHVLLVLHSFAMSRVLLPSGGFRDHLDVQSWIHNIPDDNVPSTVGNIPRWIADPSHPPPAGRGHYPDFLGRSQRVPNDESRDDDSGATFLERVLLPLQKTQVNQLLQLPLGRYTLLGHGLFARQHQDINELGDIHTAELGIRKNVPLGDFATTRHNKTP